VEVAVAAHSNGSAATNAADFDKYGKHFDPHFVILMNDPVNMWHLEPTLLEQGNGWVRGHTPFPSFDFDKAGRLTAIPQDSNWEAYSIKPANKPIVGGISVQKGYFLLTDYPELVERSFQLFQAVIHEKYVNALRQKKGRLIVAAGYIGAHYPTSNEGSGPYMLAKEKYMESLRSASEAADADFFDLSDPVLTYDFKKHLSWGDADVHLSPFGHYLIARSLADKMLELPQFQEHVEQARKRLSDREVSARLGAGN
jgi:hypothetical protein